jgi:molybdopterin-containing oxidoreductase family iron-sulfur binding subunit
MRLGMVIDLKRCVGCYACQIACKVENGTRPGTLWARVVRRETGRFPDVRRVSIPLLCMHCRDAACVEVCPTGASQRREDGVVFIDADRCAGCRYCMMACPYGARSYQDETRAYFAPARATPFEERRAADHPECVVEKCDFCRHRLARGVEPACVANCMTRARIFGDLEDPLSEVSRLIREQGGVQLHAELGTDPSVFYLPAQRRP